MRVLVPFWLPLLLVVPAFGQGYGAYVNAETNTSVGSDSLWVTVGGERHGVSFFRRERFPGVEYEPGDTLTFDRYHTVEVMYAWLRRWAEQYPTLVDLYEVGRSFEGRPILQVTLTNKETGAHTDKPAAFFEGGRHSGEITSSESVLWLIQHLLTAYGTDPQITALLDANALYLRPQNNPDGATLYLHSAQSNRSSVRPHDSDRDGLVDEDPPEDLDGDGVIYTMRRRVGEGEEDKGNAILDPRDPSGRLMRFVPEGLGDWIVTSEGRDNDGDGKVNEDGIGGLDLHRNYPENWRPEPGQEATGRGYTQFGAGAYPLSEPETRSVVLWTLRHPNISVANSMDTRVPMHLRPPSTSRSNERMFPEDLRYYTYFDSLGVRLTGYYWAGDVYEGFFRRTPVDPVTGDPWKPVPLFGHGPDYGYFYYGAIWYGDELWDNGRREDYNADGIRDDYDALVYADRTYPQGVTDGRVFKPWTAFDHPDYGPVEIGGFHPKFFAQNGPPEELERWAKNQALFNLQLALHLPRIVLDDVSVERLQAGADSATYRITARWTNTGRLPTALEQAKLVKIVQEDRARLVFADSLTHIRRPVVKILDPALFDKTVYAGWTQPGETKTVQFTVCVYGTEPVEGELHVLSTRGGKQTAAFRLER